MAARRGHHWPMIFEVNMVEIDPADATAFEAGFTEAARLLRQAHGCHNVALRRCVEYPGRYLVELRWATLADHVEGYRGGPIAPQVRAIIGSFIRKLDPMHFEAVDLQG